jgi:hypothetical protein
MECSRPWLLALSALVVLNTISLLGSWRLTQETAAAHQQTAVWKNYALTAHDQGMWAAELDAQVTAPLALAQPLPRFSF